jgi:dienelactone hydrolase
MSDRTKFMTQPALEKRFDRIARQSGLRARNSVELRLWRTTTRKKLEDLLGMRTYRECPLRPVITEEIDYKGMTRQRVEIHTESDVIMPFYVLIPKGKGPFVPIIATHGHSPGAKSGTIGDRTHPEIAADIDNARANYGQVMAEAGFIVFCPDARGFGERREAYSINTHQFGRQSCAELNNMGLPLGQCVTGMWVWDIMRLLDYIGTRKDVRPGGVGCAGLSGGGHQALWAAALDDRITCAIVSGYFYGYKSALLDLNWNCSCNYVPHVWEHIDMGDLGALIAPRALLIESGTKDDLNGTRGIANVVSQVKIARQAYRILDVKERLAHDIFEDGHRWNGEKTTPWLRRWLIDADL